MASNHVYWFMGTDWLSRMVTDATKKAQGGKAEEKSKPSGEKEQT